jgi:hypothetical protein
MFSFASICQLYTYDEVFKDIDINDKLDRDTLINTIMDVCGMNEPIYPEIEILQIKVQYFFKKHKEQFDKLVYLYSLKYGEDYNPIWNKDGTKTHVETTVRSKDNSVDDTRSNSITDNGEDISQVSAYDTNGFSNDSKTINSNRKNENGSQKTRGNEKENIKLTIEDIEKGNIGVTTTADMINQEINLQSKFNIYEVIARMFFDEFCLHVAYTNQLPY